MIGVKKEQADFARAVLKHNTQHKSNKEPETTEIQGVNREINEIEGKRRRKAAKRIAQTSMQRILLAERDRLLREKEENDLRYWEAEEETKSVCIWK